MTSIVYGGKLRLKPVGNNKPVKNAIQSFFESYPDPAPIVYLECNKDLYYTNKEFSVRHDSVVMAKNDNVVFHTRTDFKELLTKDVNGKNTWIDARMAPLSIIRDDKYHNKMRSAYEFKTVEYDLKTLEKKTYKMVLDETSKLEDDDYEMLKDMLDADSFDNHTFVKKGVLEGCYGENDDIVIPETVKRVKSGAFMDYIDLNRKTFNSISIPKSVTDIDFDIATFCKVNKIYVSEDNPRYYTQNGCLIDRKTKTLVWGYSGDTIPDDGSVKKIGPYAFYYRKDIKSITIPKTIKEIGEFAFNLCTNMEELNVNESVQKIGSSAFTMCHSLKKVYIPERFYARKKDLF